MDNKICFIDYICVMEKFIYVFCLILFKFKDNKLFNNIYYCNLVVGYFVFKFDLDVEKLRYNFMVYCGK